MKMISKLRYYFINEHGNIEISTKIFGIKIKFLQLMNLESLEEKVLNSCDVKTSG